MFASITGSIVFAVSYFFKFLSGITEYFRTKSAVDSGKVQQQADNIIANQKIQDEQNQILIQDRPKTEVIDKLEKGTF